ncbi:MAG TPA: DUF447 domain-containing protein [Gemmataceae bacterium]|jgi:hypothetical protein|nr:DUF447 domain-containing protein [Gemmataceae bacterium]
MILEGLVTTTDPNGAMHLAPMGPRVEADWSGFLLRPFQSSQTYRNLKAHGQGVLHVTDDVLLLAQAAVGRATPQAARRAERVAGFVLTEACRFYEFEVRSMDEAQERVQIRAEVVHPGTLREFFGLNRAKHAVVEAAILATRLHLIPLEEIRAEYRKLRVLVEKTGGLNEHAAFAFLSEHIGGLG